MNTLPDTLTALMSSIDPRTLYLVNGLPFTKIYQVTEMISQSIHLICYVYELSYCFNLHIKLLKQTFMYLVIFL